MQRINLSMPADLRARIKAAKGDASEGDWLRRAAIEKLVRDRYEGHERRIALIEKALGIKPPDTSRRTEP